ncbi:BrnT family toxin [Rhizobium sp. PP-CC-3G-465]|uniref:BrnT family toxin n=1 Tax=Rhizobium sp. PP-CC-3G-465 TaxID=2135648 RepID=UPI00104ED92F|nr:hypothetical protein C8J33_10642 [Rhizobium sp. PP-CC-3G-465]
MFRILTSAGRAHFLLPTKTTWRAWRSVFDEIKRRSNIRKHGYDFDLIEHSFFVAARIFEAKQGRKVAIGPIGPNLISVIFVPLGREGLSVLSMRRASKKERRAYGIV